MTVTPELEQAVPTPPASAVSDPSRSPGWAGFRYRFVRSRAGMLGLVILALYGLMALAHPILLATTWPPEIYDPMFGNGNVMALKTVVPDGTVTDHATEIAYSHASVQRVWGVRLGEQYEFVHHPRPFTRGHLLGVDSMGRDVFSMTMAAARPSFVLGLVAAFVTATIGIAIPAFAAYKRGKVDLIVEQVAGGFILLPAPLLLIILGMGGGPTRDLGPVWFGLIYGLVAGLGATAVVVRTRALTIMSAPFMDAVRVTGAGTWHTVRTHLLPHLIPVAAVSAMAGVAGVILADSFLSFLGITRDRMNWGSIIYWAMSSPPSVFLGVPWIAFLAGTISITGFVAGFYLIALGVRKATDPFAASR